MMESAKNSSLYHQLAESIKEYITRHALAPGDRIPSVVELCSLFSISHTTVRAALKVLIDEGVVESRHRQGVFVRQLRDEKLSLHSQKIIALLVPNGDHSYEAGIIRGVTEQSHSAGYRVIIANSSDNAEKEAAQLLELSRQVVGLIVFPSFEGGNYPAYAELLERGIPWVFVDRNIPGLAAPLVATDNEYGGYLATRHLLEQGCRQVYAINAKIVTSTQERLLGHRRALKEWGVANPQQFVRHSPTHTFSVGYEFTREIIEQKSSGERIGIFALDEYLARTCYTAIKEAGLRIPEDVAVVGYDDIAAMFFEPPLTAIWQDSYQMGASAVEVLLEMVRSNKTAQREVRLKPELRVRNSSDIQSRFSWASHRSIEKENEILLRSSLKRRPALTPATN